MSCLFLFPPLRLFIFNTWSIQWNEHASANSSVVTLSQNSSLNSESLSIWMTWLENLSVWGYCECLVLMLSKNLGSSSSWVCCSLEREAPEQFSVLLLLRHPFPPFKQRLCSSSPSWHCTCVRFICSCRMLLLQFGVQSHGMVCIWPKDHPVPACASWAGAASTRAGCSLPCLNHCCYCAAQFYGSKQL